MLDTDASPLLMQRARGRAAVVLTLRRGGVRLQDLHQSGSAKAYLPSVHRSVPEVVFLNTSGGLTEGDRLEFALELGAGAAAVATTQTAERAYCAISGRAEVIVRLSLGAGARLDWVPQETILFDRSALSRRTEVDMAADARLLLVESVVLGREAMGEQVRSLDFSDWRQVRRAGVLDWVEPLRLTGPALEGQAALLGSGRAFASVALFAPEAEAMLAPVRAVLAGLDGVEAGASAMGGKCLVRLLATGGFPLRRALAMVLNILRGQPLPRVWQILGGPA